jgi:hypothetical protein
MRKSILNMVVVAAAAATGIAQAATPTIGSWTLVANQSGSFTISGTTPKIVRYGNGTKWVNKMVVGPGQCTTAFFGGNDPYPGTNKMCQVFSTTTAVAPPPSYNVKLSWTIPTTRQNGKALALSELKGYEVYYATDNNASTANDTVVTVSGGSINTSTISKLPAGTYYFSISAIDVNGVKSPLSAMVSTKVGS